MKQHLLQLRGYAENFKSRTSGIQMKNQFLSLLEYILLLAQNENVDGAKALGVESIVSHLIFLILGGLRSFNRKSFRASPNSHFELGGVYTKSEDRLC